MIINSFYLIIITLIATLWLIIFIYSVILNDLLTVTILFVIYLASFLIYAMIFNQINEIFISSYQAIMNDTGMSVIPLLNILYLIGVLVGLFIFIKIIILIIQ